MWNQKNHIFEDELEDDCILFSLSHGNKYEKTGIHHMFYILFYIKKNTH